MHHINVRHTYLEKETETVFTTIQYEVNIIITSISHIRN